MKQILSVLLCALFILTMCAAVHADVPDLPPEIFEGPGDIGTVEDPDGPAEGPGPAAETTSETEQGETAAEPAGDGNAAGVSEGSGTQGTPSAGCSRTSAALIALLSGIALMTAAVFVRAAAKYRREVNAK